MKQTRLCGKDVNLNKPYSYGPYNKCGWKKNE